MFDDQFYKNLSRVMDRNTVWDEGTRQHYVGVLERLTLGYAGYMHFLEFSEDSEVERNRFQREALDSEIAAKEEEWGFRPSSLAYAVNVIAEHLRANARKAAIYDLLSKKA